MYKSFSLAFFFMMFSFISNSYGQLGVNSKIPSVTFDIAALNAKGDSTNVDGLLIPRVDRLRAQSMTTELIPISTMIYVDDISTGSQTGLAINIDKVGFYFYNGIAWVKIESKATLSNNNDGTFTFNSGNDNTTVINAVMSKFFYMPSIVIPTEVSDPSYNESTKEFTLDLYKLYSYQFNTTVISSDSMSKLPVLTESQLDYFVTYADSSVFDIISLDVSGVLKYKLKEGYQVTEKTFMNVVLKVK